MPDAAAVVVAPESKPAPVAEAKPAPEAAPVADDTAKRLGALAVRERKEREARESLVRERAAMAADLAEVKRIKSILDNAKRDPAGHLRSIYGDQWKEHIAGVVVNDGKATPELLAAATDEKIAALEKRIADEKAAEKAASDKALEEQWSAEVSEFVKAKPDDYELINLYDAGAYVQAFIRSEHARTGKILDTKTAADKVEALLEEKAAQSKRLKAKLAPPPPAPEPKPAPKAPLRTITNEMAGASSTQASAPRTQQEAWDRAMAVLKASRGA